MGPAKHDFLPLLLHIMTRVCRSPQTPQRHAIHCFTANLIPGRVGGVVYFLMTFRFPFHRIQEAHAGAVSLCTFSRTGYLATGSDDKLIKVWDSNGMFMCLCVSVCF